MVVLKKRIWGIASDEFVLFFSSFHKNWYYSIKILENIIQDLTMILQSILSAKDLVAHFCFSFHYE